MAKLDSFVDGIRAGDSQAFARWVAGAESLVRRSLCSFAARVDTEAVVQETLLRVWQVAPRCEDDGRPNGLLRLAVRIAYNLAVSETRRRRAELMDEGGLELALAQATEHTSAPIDPHLRRVLADCQDKLPKKPRAALVARLCARGLAGDRDVAESVHMTLNTFLQNVTRARRLLGDCLERHGVDLATELA